MRKVILSIMISLDGFIEGPSKELDWHVWDKEMENYIVDFFKHVDTLLFGRITYQLMADYWPSSTIEDPVISHKMNNLTKIVFTKTLEDVEWKNSRIATSDISEEISKLKQQPGKDMVMFGGADIAAAFMEQGLFDEYRIIVNPIILGGGKPLFKNGKKLNLQLTDTKKFSCGNVILQYRPL